MSKALDCLQDSLKRAKAAKATSVTALTTAQSQASQATADIAAQDAIIADITAAIVKLGGTVGS